MSHGPEPAGALGSFCQSRRSARSGGLVLWVFISATSLLPYAVRIWPHELQFKNNQKDKP